MTRVLWDGRNLEGLSRALAAAAAAVTVPKPEYCFNGKIKSEREVQQVNKAHLIEELTELLLANPIVFKETYFNTMHFFILRNKFWV